MGDPFKQVSLQTIARPDGYEYPTGLSFGVTGTTEGIPQANVATNTTGGTQTVVDNETIHTFTDSGAFVWSSSQPGFIDYVVVGGGGGGGGNNGGGGGAGGVLMRERYHLDAGSNCQITIGAGGVGGNGNNPSGQAQNGSNTTLELPTGNVQAGGGGAGGYFDWPATPGRPGNRGFDFGGSGGGGGARGFPEGPGDITGGGRGGSHANTSGENRIVFANGSFSGANGASAHHPLMIGGGGGAANTGFGALGGAGFSVPFLYSLASSGADGTSNNYTFGGGGGSAWNSAPQGGRATGGAGGGGGGGTAPNDPTGGNGGAGFNSGSPGSSPAQGGAGGVNSGGGGGGGGYGKNTTPGVFGGTGGSGCVIIRYDTNQINVQVEQANAATLTTGGTQITQNGYAIHTFTSGSSTFSTRLANLEVEILAVAGGGGGGGPNYHGGGGGAGGLVYGRNFIIQRESPSAAFSNATIVIGAGAAGGHPVGGRGSNTTVGFPDLVSPSANLFCHGGGGGGSYAGTDGLPGGSGGGGNASLSGPKTAGLSVQANTLYNTLPCFGFGNPGGNGQGPTPHQGGGGGGAGGIGETGSRQNPSGVANGGYGLSFSISGTVQGYAGGGGGSIYSATPQFGRGGLGFDGGGDGAAASNSFPAKNGLDNRGGGGGGGERGMGVGTGGSGVVHIRYLMRDRLANQVVASINTSNAGTNTTGGTQTDEGNFMLHTYNSSSYFKPTVNVTADVLCVAGGGGGGGQGGGGGGAGGLLYLDNYVFEGGQHYSVNVGAGGSTSTGGAQGNPGSNTEIHRGNTFQVIMVERGGGGGTSQSPSTPYVGVGQPGGSGGGSSGYHHPSYSEPVTAGGAANTGQGSVGGSTGPVAGGAGGGGAGAAGSNAHPGGNPGSNLAAAGGSGLSFGISGEYRAYAGGGGAGGRNPPIGIGGVGGGAAGAMYPSYVGGNGGTNRGGGGGGGGPNPATGGAGGSGVVFIRYNKVQVNALTGIFETEGYFIN